MTVAEVSDAGPLKRSLGLWLTTLYGLGTTIGAGIYVLVGTVAGEAGRLAPWSFVVSAVIAGLAAACFAELAKRHPKSAGEAHYVLVAFDRHWLSLVVGGLVVLTAIASAGTIARGAAGYLGLYIPLPEWALIALTVALLAALCAWGIKESARFAGAITLIEVSGILLVIGAGFFAEAEIDPAALLPGSLADLPPILAGTLIAFFAFVGFEHMVNVAEEVREPERVLPRAILLTLLITTALYVLLAAVAVSVIAPQMLAGSEAPLALIWEKAGGAGWILAAIGTFATLNGLLAMMILGSRVLFGLARQGSLPEVLGRVHERRRTPLLATAIIAAAVLLGALALPIAQLAEISSLFTLVVFSAVAAALLKVLADEGKPWSHRMVPLLALSAILAFLGYDLARRLGG
ncbi:MAG TPA: APC family permease [Kiloniellales bacterium]|nr:APC family permease [Kiloniellales bacterium]